MARARITKEHRAGLLVRAPRIRMSNTTMPDRVWTTSTETSLCWVLMARTFAFVFLLLGTVAITNAQTAFEVASLKPNHSGEGGYQLSLYPGGRLQGRNMSLQHMIQIAWDLKEKDQVTGTLSWLDTDKYDLDA